MVPLSSTIMKLLYSSWRITSRPAGTLANGTLTMSASAGDGQRFCLQDTQTQSAITINANTNQSLGGLSTPTALVAGTRYCWIYNLPLATWLRYV